MSICILCNRTFGSDRALKQHEENSPKHAPFDPKACNRSFSSQTALSQHQHNSPVQKKTRSDSVTSSVAPVPFTHYVPLLFSTSRSIIHNGRRGRHTTTESSSRTNPTFDLPFNVLENRLRALTLTDGNTIVAPPKIDQAHIATQQEVKTSFTFPQLHQRIAEAVVPEITSTWFNYNTKAPFEDRYTTCVMGKFTCENKACRKRQWSSTVVAIGIRRYPRNGYNAVVYNQHCNSCQWLGSFKLDEKSYVERIAYRLKNWAGVAVEQPLYGEKTRGPHESHLCEGCKVDDCPWMKRLSL
ncbi:zinc-binding domain-containing protein [Alternaria rosae]|uniref:zinc-binding domain-containing protein n=1 Tax=Alternaria rosae TaxID=1187941 RepID=UPI001E8CFE12|nr:zinc-binding domain-containing protein [Alternaria rosae]KAH6878753.1 zinc-binding domain-containing protein [Alternaria rosae]